MADVSGQPTSSLVLNHVGETKRKGNKKIDINITVMVKRKDAVVENVNLLDEFRRIIDSDLPDFSKKFIKMPSSFRFDLAKLNKIEGFPEKAREIVEKQKVKGGVNLDKGLDKWAEIAQAENAENQGIIALEGAFKESAGLLWSGLKKEKLFMLVRRTLGFSGNQTGQASPMDIKFYEMIGIDVDSFNNDVSTLVSHIFLNPANSSLSERDIISNLTPALRIIKPAFSGLHKEAQNKYRQKLEGHIKQTFKAVNAESQGGTMSKDQLQVSLTRHLLAYLDRKDEFDTVIFDRTSSTLIHQEVKSWPQNGDLECDRTFNVFNFTNFCKQAIYWLNFDPNIIVNVKTV